MLARGCGREAGGAGPAGRAMEAGTKKGAQADDGVSAAADVRVRIRDPGLAGYPDLAGLAKRQTSARRPAIGLPGSPVAARMREGKGEGSRHFAGLWPLRVCGQSAI